MRKGKWLLWTLAAMLLAGCSLARPEAAGRSQDRFIGFHVVRSDLAERQGFWGDGNPDLTEYGSDSLAVEGYGSFAVPRRVLMGVKDGEDYRFPGLEAGYSLYVLQETKENGMPSVWFVSSMAPSEEGLRTSVTDEGTENAVSGTIYYGPPLGDEDWDAYEDQGVWTVYRVYQTPEGAPYLDGSGNWALNSDANVKAVEYIKQLIDSGYCNSAPYTDTRYPLQDAFSAGTLAMMIGPMNMVSADSSVNYQSVGIPTNTGTSTGLGVCDQLMVFKNDSVKDQDARTKAISAFFDFFYDCERYSDYMVYEGFLPATSDSSDYLASNAEKHKVGGSDATGNSEYFKTFCAQLPNCQFYPMSKSEWMDVRNGVIEVEQQVCQGSISAKDALDNLQKSIAG